MRKYKVTFVCKELGLAPTIIVETEKTLSELRIAYKGHFLGKPMIKPV